MLTFLLCDYVLDVTVKDSDKEHEEEKLIPDYDEEGNYIRLTLTLTLGYKLAENFVLL